MYVRLASAWVDPRGAVHNAGDVVDIDAVTLAELEEQGVVEDPKSPTDGTSDATGTVDPSTIGPGPGVPKPTAPEKIGPGPGAPQPDSTQIGPGPGSTEV